MMERIRREFRTYRSPAAISRQEGRRDVRRLVGTRRGNASKERHGEQIDNAEEQHFLVWTERRIEQGAQAGSNNRHNTVRDLQVPVRLADFLRAYDRR